MTPLKLNLTLSILIALILAASALVGPTPLSLNDFVEGLLGIGGTLPTAIIWEIRIPRAIAALIAGAALGGSGAAMQGLFRNPLAEPGTLGISAVSTLGATIALYFGLINGIAGTMVAAMSGGLIATLFLSVVALYTNSVATLLLVGIGLSSLAGAVMALALNFSPTPFTLSDLINWTLGTVANRSWIDIAWGAPFVGLGLSIAWRQRRELTGLGMGDEVAYGLGIDLRRTRLMVVLGTGIATGASVALAGAIGFVGIVAPHIVRPWVGHDPGKAIIPSALLGGMLLMIADILIRIIPSPTEMKLGVITALVGAPIFIAIVTHRMRGER